MKIRRIILKGVRNFGDFEWSFEDEWSGRVPAALLCVGPNGSGKSTLLAVIAELWVGLVEILRGRFDTSEWQFPTQVLFADPGALRDGLAAIEIIDLDRQPVWLMVGNKVHYRNLNTQHLDSHRVVISAKQIPEHASMTTLVSLKYYPPGRTESTSLSAEHPRDHVWLVQLSDRLTKNILGKSQDLPNIVFLESESRTLLPLKEKFEVTREPDEYLWLARYEPTTSRKGSLHNYLYNLKVVDDTAFQEIVDQVNSFLRGKRLNGFSRRTGDLMIKMDNGSEHSIDLLSSGEKQVLLMLTTITRWLRPGGILLVDEPDLHLHVALMTAFVDHLRRMAVEKNGQLILASHAPELWRLFTESHLVRLGSLEPEKPA